MTGAVKREKQRDTRDYDTTQLREVHRRTLGRDYSAHFFRWSFARRLIGKDDDVLEIGCGQDQPLAKLLVIGLEPKCRSYTGVDLNPLKESAIKRLNFAGEFNFVERWKELPPPKGSRNFQGYSVLVHLEVIEHMHVKLGKKFLEACFASLKPGGRMLMSTPCYDGKRHAANHIHEYTVPELTDAVRRVGFAVERRFGTFMDIRHIGKEHPSARAQRFIPPSRSFTESVGDVYHALSEYYDHDALSCFFAPLYPDHARNNLWVCVKPK